MLYLFVQHRRQSFVLFCSKVVQRVPLSHPRGESGGRGCVLERSATPGRLTACACPRRGRSGLGNVCIEFELPASALSSACCFLPPHRSRDLRLPKTPPSARGGCCSRRSGSVRARRRRAAPTQGSCPYRPIAAAFSAPTKIKCDQTISDNVCRNDVPSDPLLHKTLRGRDPAPMDPGPRRVAPTHTGALLTEGGPMADSDHLMIDHIPTRRRCSEPWPSGVRRPRRPGRGIVAQARDAAGATRELTRSTSGAPRGRHDHIPTSRKDRPQRVVEPIPTWPPRVAASATVERASTDRRSLRSLSTAGSPWPGSRVSRRRTGRSRRRSADRRSARRRDGAARRQRVERTAPGGAGSR